MSAAVFVAFGPASLRPEQGLLRGFSFALMVRTLDLSRWAGRWVALGEGDEVRCDAETLGEFLTTLDADGVEGVLVMRAPALDEPLTNGGRLKPGTAAAGLRRVTREKSAGGVSYRRRSLHARLVGVSACEWLRRVDGCDRWEVVADRYDDLVDGPDWVARSGCHCGHDGDDFVG